MTTATATPTTAPAPTPAVIKKDIVDVIQATVSNYVTSGELHLPADYSPGNALKSAFLILQTTLTPDKKPVLSHCSQVSIHNALYSMVVQGLNPDKKQCYFIPYGTSLTCQRSYFGSIALAKRLDPNISDVVAEVVYEGDVLKYKIIKGRKLISDHEQSFGGENREIIGAYAMVLDRSGEVVRTELMTIQQIYQSWRMSRQSPFDENGQIKAGSVHGKFKEDMAKRTVLNKICKPIINSSSDSAILNKVLRQGEDAAFEAEYQATANSTPLEYIQQHPNDTCNGEIIDGQAGEVIIDQEPEGREEPPPQADNVPPFFVAS